MIPILYEANTKDFQNNGIGRLSDAVSCLVTEARNGIFELEMQYPVSGERFADLKSPAIIVAEPAPNRTHQRFRIYKISKPLKGIVTVYAEHCSYQLSHIPVTPFSAASAVAAMEGMKTNAVEECPFEFITDKTTEGSFSSKAPKSIRALLGGTGGSVIDSFGGELEFDNQTVSLWSARGADRGVTLRYGKNITDLKQEENIANTITGIYPYWLGSDEIVMLAEKVIHAENADRFPYHRTVTLDMTSYFEEKPTEDELRSAAQSYVKRNALGVPDVSISVSFVPLWQMEEYKNIAPLERVDLCDTITVEYEQLGVSAKAKVTKTVYNVLLGKYDKIELGSARTSLEKVIGNQQKAIAEKVSDSILSGAVKHATDMITGVAGGNIILRLNANGKPYEMLIMDTGDITTAQNIIRFNMAGIGFSTTGINGPYKNAWTIDGNLVAEFITTCKLTAGTIGGWLINENAIYKDVVMEDGTVYRVFFQPPVEQYPTGTWILSCQKSTDGGKTFTGSFVLYSDGSAKFGSTKINADGSAEFGNTKISASGEIAVTTENGTIDLGKEGLSFNNTEGGVNTKISSIGEILVNMADGSMNLNRNGLAFYNADGKSIASIIAKIGDSAEGFLYVGNLFTDFINGYSGHTETMTVCLSNDNYKRLEFMNGLLVDTMEW